MAIPDYETIMLPLLQLVSDGKEHSINEAALHIANLFKLTPVEKEQRLPSGQSTYIKNRTGSARTYLKKAGLLSAPKRGFIGITERGRLFLGSQQLAIAEFFSDQAC